MKPSKKFSKMIVVTVIVLNVLFTCAMMYIFSKTYCEPSTLIIAWFAFTGTELFNLAGIKKEEVKNLEVTKINKEEYNGY